jgi:hypothetical protein
MNYFSKIKKKKKSYWINHFQQRTCIQEKRNRAAELILANKELDYQNQEKQNRATELITANKVFALQNQEKTK